MSVNNAYLVFLPSTIQLSLGALYWILCNCQCTFMACLWKLIKRWQECHGHLCLQKEEDTKGEEETKDKKEDDRRRRWVKESAMGGSLFFLFIQIHSPCSPPFPFYYLVKWKNKETKDEEDTKEKVSAMGGIIFFFLFKYTVISPISFLLSCKTKGQGYKGWGGDKGREGGWWDDQDKGK